MKYEMRSDQEEGHGYSFHSLVSIVSQSLNICLNRFNKRNTKTNTGSFLKSWPNSICLCCMEKVLGFSESSRDEKLRHSYDLTTVNRHFRHNPARSCVLTLSRGVTITFETPMRRKGRSLVRPSVKAVNETKCLIIVTEDLSSALQKMSANTGMPLSTIDSKGRCRGDKAASCKHSESNSKRG